MNLSGYIQEHGWYSGNCITGKLNPTNKYGCSQTLHPWDLCPSYRPLHQRQPSFEATVRIFCNLRQGLVSLAIFIDFLSLMSLPLPPGQCWPHFNSLLPGPRQIQSHCCSVLLLAPQEINISNPRGICCHLRERNWELGWPWFPICQIW